MQSVGRFLDSKWLSRGGNVTFALAALRFVYGEIANAPASAFVVALILVGVVLMAVPYLGRLIERRTPTQANPPLQVPATRPAAWGDLKAMRVPGATPTPEATPAEVNAVDAAWAFLGHREGRRRHKNPDPKGEGEIFDGNTRKQWASDHLPGLLAEVRTAEEAGSPSAAKAGALLTDRTTDLSKALRAAEKAIYEKAK